MLYRIDFEIGIYPNRIQICDRRSGRFVDFAAESPFSAPGRLVNDTVYFENALARATRKALSGGFILLDAQAYVNAAGSQLSLPERKMIRSALADIGFREVRVEGDPGDIEPMPPIPPILAALF